MRNKLAWIGTIFTAIYLFAFTAFIFGRLPQLQTMELNAVGDFLAGAFGPIAFFWLILGFMQQGTELRVSADALRMQADELKASVQQQTSLVAAQQLSLENHERSLEPLLQLKYTGGQEDDGDYYSGFLLTNLGSYCEGVNVVLCVEGVDNPPISLEPLYNGVGRSFFLDDVFGGGRKSLLSISYMKSSGLSNSQSFELYNYHDESGEGIGVKKVLNKDSKRIG
ncbi:hypothetical protein AYK59_19200 [Pseudomonas synxantha]|uniref:hypothetical protein n=1 Tax=Pseudomonas synxantha TaxID=47883 RepID=UPI00078B963D|nr:hypothetical protein [Pseudomonas synxantha]AMS22155.1 hypothetical protein AYK59_19200 [Pseudomonas synxantha]